MQFNDLKEKNIKLGTEIKIIAKEIINYMWFYIIISLTILLYYSKIIGDSTPTNQESVNNILNNNPSIFYMIFVAVLGPMIEEAIFRFLPYNSFNNKIFFILVSGFIFAFLHCIDDPNPFTYLPFYLLPSLYLGYRYYKTEDIFVTMSIHILINISSLK